MFFFQFPIICHPFFFCSSNEFFNELGTVSPLNYINKRIVFFASLFSLLWFFFFFFWLSCLWLSKNISTHPWWILNDYIIFGGSDIHHLIFLKCPSNELFWFHPNRIFRGSLKVTNSLHSFLSQFDLFIPICIQNVADFFLKSNFACLLTNVFKGGGVRQGVLSSMGWGVRPKAMGVSPQIL